MFFAIVNGVKVEASPKELATCDFCGSVVSAKCGDIYQWHWAHPKGVACDPWSKQESNWHLNWKKAFGKERSEVIINKEGIKHRADVLTPSGVVLEFQSSPISLADIEAREEFYGQKMLWVINAYSFESNIITSTVYPYMMPRYFLVRPEGFIDPDNNELYACRINHTFRWKRARTTWSWANRRILLDFGRDTLFVLTTKVDSQGEGYFIYKKWFLERYGGDTQMLNELIFHPDYIQNKPD